MTSIWYLHTLYHPSSINFDKIFNIFQVFPLLTLKKQIPAEMYDKKCAICTLHVILFVTNEIK